MVEMQNEAVSDGEKNVFLFDAHAHYNDSMFDADRDELVKSVFENGNVKYAVNAGTTIITSLECIELAEKYPFFYAAVGIHPEDCGKIEDSEGNTIDSDSAIKCLEKMLLHPKVVALGEIGLDFHYDEPSKEIQTEWFCRQMKLAEKLGVPVVIHDRDAHGACLEIVKKFPNVNGVFHCYSGSAETVRELIELGYYISFGGVLTFKNAIKSAESIKAVPLDRLLIETDCPYLTPQPFRGSRNDSGYMIYTAHKAAELKEISYEELCDVTFQNSMRFYSIGN